MAGNGCNAVQDSFFLMVADSSNIYMTALPHYAHYIIHLTIHLHITLAYSRLLIRFGGGAQTNRSARIYRALVETQLAAYAGSGYGASHDTARIRERIRQTQREGAKQWSEGARAGQ